MSGAVFVLTSRRTRGEPWAYIEETARQLDAEQLDVERVLFYDGERPPPALAPTWPRVQYARAAGALPGNKLPYFALLEYCFNSGYDDVVVLEDDLQLCTNALRRMVTFPVPADLAFVQFFSPHIFKVPDTIPGLWRPPRTTAMFAQAIKYPRRTLGQLVEWIKDPEFGRYNSSDDSLNLCAARRGWRYGAHAPDLVQHVGEASNVTEQGLGGRVSSCFSPALDAMLLYGRDDLYR